MIGSDYLPMGPKPSWWVRLGCWALGHAFREGWKHSDWHSALVAVTMEAKGKVRGMPLILYHVVPSPRDGLSPGSCVDEFPLRKRWAHTFHEAKVLCHLMCNAIGPRPKPGWQNTDDVPVCVFVVEFADVADVAAGTVSDCMEVYRLILKADGTCSEARK